jgi:hypothetical protein
MTPITPLEPGVEQLGMYQRGNSKLFINTTITSARTSLERPVSAVSDAYTDIEDDSSEFEEYSLGSSVSAISQVTHDRLQTDLILDREPQEPDDNIHLGGGAHAPR